MVTKGSADGGAANNAPEPAASARRQTTSTIGASGEARALAHLLRYGLTLVERNYRVARGPQAHGGEIDLILRDRDGTLVFVEVRTRAAAAWVGAASSISSAKRRSLVRAAQHFLQRQSPMPPCRFDVIAIDGDRIEWLKAAFDDG